MTFVQRFLSPLSPSLSLELFLMRIILGRLTDDCPILYFSLLLLQCHCYYCFYFCLFIVIVICYLLLFLLLLFFMRYFVCEGIHFTAHPFFFSFSFSLFHQCPHWLTLTSEPEKFLKFTKVNIFYIERRPGPGFILSQKDTWGEVGGVGGGDGSRAGGDGSRAGPSFGGSQAGGMDFGPKHLIFWEMLLGCTIFEVPRKGPRAWLAG